MGVAAQKLTRKEEILNELNEQQRLPVVDYKGASIVIAGAGSGKTRVIVARTAYMIEDGVDPKSILLFTFTRKAANEIKDRVIHQIGEKGKKVTVGTYHSFCVRLLRKYVEALGIWDRNFSIYDTEDSEKILKDILKKMGDTVKGMTSTYVAAQISRWKEKMMSVSEAGVESENDSSKGIVAQIYKTYSENLRAQNSMDFDDLIYVTIRLFEKFPEIKEQVNKKYRYIVADESQDSGTRDLEMIFHLGGTEMNVCLVGDDYQSIYSFRGSNIESFFEFVNQHKLKKFFLSQNYRSTKTIVNAAQSVIEHNISQFEKDISSENEKGNPVVVYEVPDEKTEALRATQIVKALNNKGYNLNDIAILYRASYMSRKIEDAFVANGIRYRMLSGTPFYARKEIKDLIAYFRFLLNPKDQMALERALKCPAKGIGDASILQISSCLYDSEYDILETGQLKSILSNIKLRGKAQKGLELFTSIIETLEEEKNKLTPVKLLQRLVILAGYFDFLKEDDKESFEDRKNNVEELYNIAAEYSSLEDFVDNITSNDSDENEDTEAVNMLTIHGSKGLEFRVVILVGCNQGSIPHFRSIEEGNIEEERRLFYVAMTRAKELLFMTRPKRTIHNGAPFFQMPSIFLKEIDKQYVRKI